MEIARKREEALSRILMAFVTTGVLFMVFPGTFLGVWNLLQISGKESVALISPAWLQAHGHAQVFGWVGSFILGIGFYSIPKQRGAKNSSFWAAWLCWGMWTVGTALRWGATLYSWEWRILLPISALLELAAFLIFFRTVSQHRPEDPGKDKLEPWVWVVISASIGLLLVLLSNVAGSFYLADRGTTPALPHGWDQRYLALVAWGFLVPFVWGFSAKWMSVFLGLKPLRQRLLLTAVLVNFVGVTLALMGSFFPASCLFLLGTSLAITALRMFESSVKEAKTRGVHSSFPFFVRMAYGWLFVAGALGLAAVGWDTSRRNLGRIASCINSWIHIRHDLERRATHSTCICWHEAAVEHKAHVCRIGIRHFGLHVARVLRGRRLPGLRELGVVGLARLGIVRARGADHLCRKHSRNFHASA